jgi:glutaredoxin
MKYYRIIAWSNCPYCIRAKEVMIEKGFQFEFCCVTDSKVLLNHYKTIYNYGTVPIIIEKDTESNEERFIGGYSDFIIEQNKQKENESCLRVYDPHSGERPRD